MRAASNAAPLYAAEIAPAWHRGRFVSAYQLAITLGIFVSYFVDAALAEQQAWRLMLGVSAVPAALLVLAILMSIESPRWLLKVRRVDEAREALGAFIRESHRNGIRCVRVVHGKGLGSPGKAPVLKEKVHKWLVQKAEVVAFVQAQPAQGGAGALVVLLQPQNRA